MSAERRPEGVAHERERDRERERVWFAALFVTVMALLAALPLAYRYLPLVDWPQQLAQDAIVNHRGDPSFGTDTYYQETGWFLPYQGFRRLHVAAARALGDDLRGGRATLALVLALALRSVYAVARALGRSPWIALAGATVIIDGNVLWGFAPYVFATALSLLQIALALRWLARPQGPRSTLALVGLALLGVGQFFTHAQPTMLSCVAIAALALSARARGRITSAQLARLALALAPSALLLVSYLSLGGWLSGQALEDAFRIRPKTSFRSPWAALRALPLASGLGALGGGALIAYLLALLGGALGAMHVTLDRDDRTQRSRPSRAERRTPEASVLAAVFVAAYVLLPDAFRGQSVAPRVASLALLSLTWLIPWRHEALRRDASSRRARWALVAKALIAAATLGSLLCAHAAFARFDRALRSIDAVIEAAPPRARVATLVYEPYMPGFDLPVLLHVGAYVLVARGGMSSMGFTRTGVTYRASVPREALTVMELWAPSADRWQLDPSRHAHYYDAVFVVRGPRYPGSPFRSSVAPPVRPRRVVATELFELWLLDRATR